jgi:hypothetical protein
VLHASVAADPERLRRFTAGAQAVAALNHPNVLTIYEAGTQGEHPFIATELLDGATLRSTLEEGSLPLSTGANDVGYLVLSADGSTVAFTEEGQPTSSIFTVSATGGVPKKICDGCGRAVAWLPDRSKLLIDVAGPKQRDIRILDLATGDSKAAAAASRVPAQRPAAVAGRTHDGLQPEPGGLRQAPLSRAVHRQARAREPVDAGRGRQGLRPPGRVVAFW